MMMLDQDIGDLGFDIVPATERMAVPIAADTARLFLDWCRETGWPAPRCEASALGWDLHRLGLLGKGEDPDMLYFHMFVDELKYADDTREWDDDCDFALMDAQIAALKRGRQPGDKLIIDMMFAGETQGWKPSLEIAVAFDRLIKLADEKRSEILESRYEKFCDKITASKPISANGATLEDFVAYMPAHAYIFKPTREMWPASSVNSRLAPIRVPGREKPLAANAWLDKNKPVEQMTWAPGKEMEIRDSLIADGGWIHRPGCTTFNLYRPPTIQPLEGDASLWINHVRYVFGDDAEHIINWLAHRRQRPQDKPNHALVLGGPQGIGKDTALEPIKQAIGPWNFSEVSPQQTLGRFNGFLKSVILRVSEARDLGDTDRYAFYEHMKAYTAAPPDVLRVDEKHLREHAVLNVCGVILTTNNKDSLHLPTDDRRHFVAWSWRTKEEFPPAYWTAMYAWLSSGGSEIVTHYLATLDLSGFDAKAPPPKTQAFWEIVDASRAPEDAEMADALDQLNRPAAVTLAMIMSRASAGFCEWLRDRKNRRRIPHRLDECGYVPVRNPDVKDGQWIIAKRRQAIYVKRELSRRDQIAEAAKLTDR